MSSDEPLDLRATSTPQAKGRRPGRTAGAGMILLAVAAIAFPAETALVVGGFGGWLLWLAAALMLGVALLTFTGALRWLGIGAAIAAVALGAYLTFNPTVGALATALVLTAALVMDGSFQLAAALHLRPLKAWRWLLVSAITSLGAAALMALGLPQQAPQAVGIVLAAAFATTGAALFASGVLHARRPRGAN
ncbi:DUF308 domain-containing protein [uncultured Phenylobacterium sp.]|uniref:DUF308 domain-containing protein n=1 Tax=uncultured Phenylobacterium sp. TaxID=349273 RepID=UPI0025FFF34A|nr:DUF308 domain-containing protein [uncultured Phenylobacterium sp.]